MPHGHRFRKVVSLHLWHRWLGLSAALFVVVLAVTGLLLNHTQELDLAERRIESPWLLHWYGIKTPTLVSFPVQTRWVSQMGRRIYLDSDPLAKTEQSLWGAVAFDGMVLAGAGERLLLWTAEGELVEELPAGLLPPGEARAMGLSASGRLALRTGSGVYTTGTELGPWLPAGKETIRWSSPGTPPPALRERLVHAYRGSGLSLERVLLDLHSGRIWGRLGPYIMDAAAIVLLLLSASGTWLWNKRARQMRAHRRARKHAGTTTKP